VLVSVILLPALLGIVGRRIDSLSVPGMKPKAEGARGQTLGARWAHAVSRRPWLSAALGAGLLVLLAIPLFGIRLGTTDAGTEPTSSTLRRSYDLLTEGFGPGFNGPLTIVVDLEGASDGIVDDLAAAIAADEHVAAGA